MDPEEPTSMKSESQCMKIQNVIAKRIHFVQASMC